MIAAAMATFPPRLPGLRRVLERIAGQVERLTLVLNEIAEIPAWLAEFRSVEPVLPARDLKDTGKFAGNPAPDDWIFTLDDDILYPPDYVTRTLAQMEAHRGRAMGGYHGSLYRHPRFLKSALLRRVLGYGPNYIVSSRDILHFEAGLDAAVVVDELGSGVAVMRGADMPSLDYMRGAERFADVRLARWCHEQGIVQICLPRPAGWLRADGAANPQDGIFETFTVTNPEAVAREIDTYAFRKPGRGKPPATLQGEVPR